MWPVTAPDRGARPLVAVLSVSLLLAGPAPAESAINYTHPSTEICSFEPQYRPVSAECDLGGTKSLNLPSSLRASLSLRQLRIFNADRVEILADAFLNLPAMEIIHLEHITTLLMKSSSSAERQGPVTIKINHIQFVRLETKSLSSWQSLDVSITNVNRTCIIHSDAIVSSTLMTNITLRNIVGGYFFSGAFSSTLGRLTLRNVTVSEPCEKRTFAGRIRELSLKDVKFPNVREDCFLAQNWSSLKIRSSQLDDISERGLRGDIKNVQIKDSRLGQISSNGFSLKVDNLSIVKTFIRVLAPGALNVHAHGKVVIKSSDIGSLRPRAFLRLVSASGARQQVILSDLNINSTSTGALRSDQSTSLKLKNILIRSRCNCRIVRRTEFLLYGRPGENHRREPHSASVHMALKNIKCLHNDQTPSRWDYYCWSCAAPGDTICSTADMSPETDTASQPAVVPVWALLLALLVFCVILILLVIRLRRQATPRRRPSYAKRPPSQRITAANIEHSLPHMSPGAPQMAPGGRPHASGRVPTADPSTYEEVPVSYNPESTSGAGYALYEELPLPGQPQGEAQAGLEPQPTQVQPLYANVDKNQGENGPLSYAVDSNDPPLYAQINKRKPAGDHQCGVTARRTACAERGGSGAGTTLAETPPPSGEEPPDLPLYSQITRKKSDHGRLEEASESESAAGYPQCSRVPAEGGAGHHALNQRSAVADGGDAPPWDSSPRRGLADAALDGPVEHGGPGSAPDSVDDPPLDASVGSSMTGEPNGDGGDDDNGDGGLQNNTLYGTRVTVN